MKKTLIFPRLHKIPHPQKVNFGIFKPIKNASSGIKKNKSVNFKKPIQKKESNHTQKSDILKENYSYIEETTFSFKNKDSILYPKPKNLYERLVLEKMKSNKSYIKNFSSDTSSDSEEKKINETTINKIKIFPDYSTTISHNYSTLISNQLKEKELMEKINERKKKKKFDIKFMQMRENKENIEKFLEKIIGKIGHLFDKNYIAEILFDNIDKDLFIQKLNEEVEKKKEEIPYYLYEDDEYIKDIFEKIAFKLILEELERKQYFYNTNEEILPLIIDYHTYLKDIRNMLNSIGEKVSLDELYNKDVYVENEMYNDPEEEKKQIKLIEKIKQKSYLLRKSKQKGKVGFYPDKKDSHQISDTLFSGSTETTNSGNYSNIITKVIKNKNRFNTRLEDFKKRRSKKMSLEKTELIAIEKMIGGHMRTSEGKSGGILNDDDDTLDDDYIEKIRLKNNKTSTISKNNNKNKLYDKDYSYLDYPGFYEIPKRKRIKEDKSAGVLNKKKFDNKKKNKNKSSNSVYTKYFKNKFFFYK